MNINSFIDLLKKNSIYYFENEPMSLHTSFKTGGAADVFVSVSSAEELNITINAAKSFELPYFIIGKGSNLLFSDDGIRGAVISLSDMNAVTLEGNLITAAAGASLSSVCIAARDNSLSGFEFAYGIPGAIGGAVYMNAGAYGGEISQILKSVKAINEKGEIICLSLEECQLGYRTSIFKTSNLVLLEATFELIKADKAEISFKMNELIKKRKEKQPLSFPSAGSTFKRPEGNFAGALIEKNNLKGFRIGGAMVSDLHAGFIINYDNATSHDILELMRHVQRVVYKNDGVLLEPEVLYVGEPPKEDILPYKTASQII